MIPESIYPAIPLPTIKHTSSHIKFLPVPQSESYRFPTSLVFLEQPSLFSLFIWQIYSLFFNLDVIFLVVIP